VVSRRNDPIEPAVITVGSVHSGSKHNIISDSARLQITVRSYTDETRKLLLDGIREVTVNVCRAMGCTREPDIAIRDDEFTPATYNDPNLTAAAVEVMERVVGAGHVSPVRARMGGEDFGRYAKHLGVPGFMFWLGCVKRETYEASLKPGGPALPAAHSSTFAPDPDPTIRTGVRSLASLALSLLDGAEGPPRPRRAIRRDR
jgi:hippurate hydrolase